MKGKRSMDRPKTILSPFAERQGLRFDVPQEKLGELRHTGRASYDYGWNDVNMIPIPQGGIPPYMQDYNGIFYDLTLHEAWACRGDFARFSEKIAAAGGYSNGEILLPDDPSWPMVLRSAVDDNTTNFNTDLEAINDTWNIVGILSSWMDTYNYPITNMLAFYDGLIYYNRVPTGPATGNAVAPGTDVRIWSIYTPGILGDYENTPDTLALRDQFGKTKVTWPVEDQDAINKAYLEKYIDDRSQGSLEFAKPIILDPEDGFVFRSLDISVNVTPLELTTGGIAIPTRTQIRVLSEDLTILYAERVCTYTVDPEISLPTGFPEEVPFKIIVRHEHNFAKWTRWSDGVGPDSPTYTLSPIFANRVPITAPVNGAVDVPTMDVLVATSAPTWSNGATFNPESIRMACHLEADGSVVWHTGTEANQWVPYTAVASIPAGHLQPATRYWLEAQAEASNTPPGAPQTDKVTPEYDQSFAEASTFTTINASPPDITGLTHDIPPEVLHGTQHTVHIWGATSTDGGAVVYSISEITGGLTFSKYNNIGEMENITMAAPTISGTQQPATLKLQAHSTLGGGGSE